LSRDRRDCRGFRMRRNGVRFWPLPGTSRSAIAPCWRSATTRACGARSCAACAPTTSIPGAGCCASERRPPRDGASGWCRTLRSVVNSCAPISRIAPPSAERGPLFLSESRRNHAKPLTPWTWSKVVRRIALAAEVPRFGTHTLRHLCLTDLARAGWELHAIATFAGHRDPATTLRYVHLSGRELAAKLARGMAQIHDWHGDAGRDRAGGTRMSGALPTTVGEPVPTLLDVAGFDRIPILSPDERDALASLGWQLRRRRSHDLALPQWGMIARLLTPLNAARRALRDRPDIALHHRSAKYAIGLILSRCAEEGAAYWGWPEEAWVRLIGEDRHAFNRPWPGFVDQTVRPYVAAYGYLLCGF
jgi:Phage integrase family